MPSTNSSSFAEKVVRHAMQYSTGDLGDSHQPFTMPAVAREIVGCAGFIAGFKRFCKRKKAWQKHLRSQAIRK